MVLVPMLYSFTQLVLPLTPTVFSMWRINIIVAFVSWMLQVLVFFVALLLYISEYFAQELFLLLLAMVGKSLVEMVV